MNAFSQVPCNHLSGIPSKEKLIESMQKKPINIRPRSFVEGCNINDSIKKLLKYHLRWQWTKAEIESYLITNLEKHKKVYQVSEKVNAIANGNDSIFKKVKDSIENVILKKELEYDISVNHIFGVAELTVLTVGWLNMKETIPFLKNIALKDSAHYAKWSVELALARLGDKKLQKQIINNCIGYSKPELDFEKDFYSKYKKLVYINTQESLYQLHEFIDTSKYVILTNEILTSFANRIIQDFPTVFANEELIKLIKLTGDEYDYNLNAILNVKKWIIANKGKYKIKKWFSPY